MSYPEAYELVMKNENFIALMFNKVPNGDVTLVMIAAFFGRK